MPSPTTAFIALCTGIGLLYLRVTILARQPIKQGPISSLFQEAVKITATFGGAIFAVLPLLYGLIWVAEPYSAFISFYIAVVPTTLIAFLLIVAVDSYVHEQREKAITEHNLLHS